MLKSLDAIDINLSLSASFIAQIVGAMVFTRVRVPRVFVPRITC